ncbi:PrgI family mobile element protein [Paenibacillus aestuarii]|uniref:PrgI family mobile element protein n=1 Tax=Paenibacillus aestuarii TaxID=516965 RepID=A0ABW0KD66_9BACL
MNEILVPIDLTQEEKEILAVFSKRQFVLIFPAGVVSLIFLLWGNIPFVPALPDFFIRLVIFLVVMGIAISLAYIRLDKYQQFLNEYVVTLWKFRKSQKTYMQ